MASLGTAYVKIAPDMSGIQGKIAQPLRQEATKASNALSPLEKALNDPFINFGSKILKGTLVAATVAAGALIVKNIGGAIKRIDTLVAFPRVLEAMGATTEQAANATQKLSDRLRGLPTPLQEGASGVQALVAAGLGVEQATDVFLAFNNATLAASTEAGAAQGAFTQLVQSISKGKIEGQEWNSIVSAMPTAFQALSKESGLTREQLRELYRTNPEKLLEDLTRLDKEGGGGLASLEKQARAATGGIGTAFDNLNNSITRGMESIVRSIGDGGTDQEKLESGQIKISNAISAVGKAFGQALANVGKFVGFMKENSAIFIPIIAAIGTFIGVITALAAVLKVAAAAKAVFAVAAAAFAAPLAPIVLGISALVGVLVYLQQRFGFVTTAINVVKAGFTTFWATIKPIRDFIATQLISAFNSLKSSFTTIQTALAPFMPQLKMLAQILGAAVLGAVVIVIGAIVGFVAVIAKVIAIAARLISIIASVVAWFARLTASVGSAMARFVSAIINGVNSAVSWFSGLPGRILGAIGNLGSLLFSAGKSLLQGLVDGIKSFASAPVDAIKNVVGKMRDLLPFSPAKTGPFSGKGYTTYSGRALMGDFAKGIASKAEDARRTAQQAMSGVQSAMTADYALNGSNGITGGLSGLSSGGHREYNIGTINIGSEVDGEAWLRKLTGNQEITSAGLTPNQRYM